MGQKVSPIGFRTGVTIGWKSRWFAPKSNYGEFLVEDEKIRKFVDNQLNRKPPYAAVSRIDIERTREDVKVTLYTARPGLVIGPKGAEVDRLKSDLEELADRRVNISIVEVRNPDLDATLVAEGIGEQLKRRASYRRAMKQRVESCMQAGAKGVKIQVSGRLGGAEIARSETQIRGSIPLHTLEANVDYGFARAITTYGVIGIKVWIYRGMFGDEIEEQQQETQKMTKGSRRRSQRGSGGSGGGQGSRRRGRGGKGKAPQAAPAAEQTQAPAVEAPAPQEAPAAEAQE